MDQHGEYGSKSEDAHHGTAVKCRCGISSRIDIKTSKVDLKPDGTPMSACRSFLYQILNGALSLRIVA